MFKIFFSKMFQIKYLYRYRMNKKFNLHNNYFRTITSIKLCVINLYNYKSRIQCVRKLKYLKKKQIFIQILIIK